MTRWDRNSRVILIGRPWRLGFWPKGWDRKDAWAFDLGPVRIFRKP